jgi:hypothetical protein
VVELKAPKVKIDQKEVLQIEEYAISVMKDERFKSVKTTWVFWVVSDDYGEYAGYRMKKTVGSTANTGKIHEAEKFRSGLRLGHRCRSAVAVPTRNDATTGYRFAVTRWRTGVDSNPRYRLASPVFELGSGLLRQGGCTRHRRGVSRGDAPKILTRFAPVDLKECPAR